MTSKITALQQFLRVYERYWWIYAGTGRAAPPAQ
jgi:hypothetical protein